MKNRNYHIEAIIICILYYIKRLIVPLLKFLLTIVIIGGLEYGIAKIISPNDIIMREILIMMFAADCIGLFVIAVLRLVNILESVSTLGELICAIEILYDYFKFNMRHFESILNGSDKTDSLLGEFLYNELSIYKDRWML